MKERGKAVITQEGYKKNAMQTLGFMELLC